MTRNKLSPVFDSEALSQVLFEQLGFSSHTDFAVAYSGGCDSHVLLHAMSELRSHNNFKLTALHFDHNLMPQSSDWARHCEKVCKQLDIAFISERQELIKKPEQNIEAQARHSRYQWFEQVVANGQVLITAHHANDQAETVLLNLLRGGSVDSLTGIPQQRTLSAEKSTTVARPLLAFPQTALADYAKQHQLSWIEDPSNQNQQFDRNYLRSEIIPALEKRWQGAIGSLVSSAENCREAVKLLDENLETLFQRCLGPNKRGVFCLASPLAIDALAPLGQFQLSRVIRYWLHQHGYRSPSTGQLITLHQQLFVENKETASIDWDELTIRCFAGHLYLLRRLDECGDGSGSAVLDWDLQPCELGKNKIRVEAVYGEQNKSKPKSTTNSENASTAMHALLDSEKLRGKSLQLAWRNGGERITLPGRKHSSSLKKLFQEHEIPPWERDSLPLLIVNGEIAWVYGIGSSAEYSADNNTADTALEIRFRPNDDSTNK